MGYRQALEAAGATVHSFERFGSYQGDWWASVTYKGITGYVRGSYGSCSGCDAFESEFTSVLHYHGEKPVWGGYTLNEEYLEDCEECTNTKDRLVIFGQKYLDGIMDKQTALDKAGEHLKWDMEAQLMVGWIKNN